MSTRRQRSWLIMGGMSRPPRDYDLLPTVLNKAQTIAARIGPATETGCWLWVGAFTLNGSGTLTVGRDGSRSLCAHRAVFMLHHERPIAEGMSLRHTCRNAACVNPDHLLEMTQAEINAVGATGGGSIQLRRTKAGVPRWAVLFREGGKQRSRTFGTLEAAQTFAAERTGKDD
jgi:hypothetical protein